MNLTSLFKLVIPIFLFAIILSSCDDKGNTPDPPVDTKITPEQVLFASAFDPTNPKLVAKGWVKPSILDGKPVVVVPVSPVPNNTNFTEPFKGFMDIEIRLIDAKSGSYSITPIIYKNSVEKIFQKGYELVPGKGEYGISIVNQAINGNLKRDLTPGISISDRDDNSPSTPTPWISQLPEKFTIDQVAKYNPFTSIKTGTFDLSKSESYRMIMDLATIGQKFDTVIYSINPSEEALKVVQN
ncbi:MAG: hypothetical protein IPH28_15565 [Cytophagaceae bacterium]|nr:hypothetical protein [Cytophagaceae bacterium]